MPVFHSSYHSKSLVVLTPHNSAMDRIIDGLIKTSKNRIALSNEQLTLILDSCGEF